MKNNDSIYFKWKHSVKLICLITIFAACYNVSFAQSVTADQNLTFGTFCPSGTSGGTITIDYNGNRTSSGNVILFNSTFSEAIFTFRAGTRNRTVYNITTNSPRTLTRVGGGGTMKLTLGTPNPTNFYVRKNQTKSFSIGGTLTVGSITANPGGNYSGTFALTFNYY
jgi:hypothetical protein